MLSLKGFDVTVLAWRWRETCEKDVGSLQKLKMAPSWQSARKWGPQTYSSKELNSAKNLDELGPRFILVRAVSLQSCPTLCDPMDCSPLGSSVHGILQAKILKWVAISSSGALPNPGMELMSHVFCIGRWVLYDYHYLETLNKLNGDQITFCCCCSVT